MTAREPEQDNPWVLAALIVVGLFFGAFGVCAWMQILDGAAR